MRQLTRLGLGAAVAGMCGALIGAVSVDSVMAGRAGDETGATAMHVASLQVHHPRSIRSAGGPATFGSLETVCTQIAQNLSEEILRSGDDGASTRELQRLMKGMHCVE